MAKQLKFKDAVGDDRIVVCDAIEIEHRPSGVSFLECSWKLCDGTSHIRSFIASSPVVVRSLYSGLRDIFGKRPAA